MFCKRINSIDESELNQIDLKETIRFIREFEVFVGEVEFPDFYILTEEMEINLIINFIKRSSLEKKIKALQELNIIIKAIQGNNNRM